MHLVNLEVLSNPLLWGWGHSGDLTADFALVVGNLTPRFVKSPVVPHPLGWGMKLTSELVINYFKCFLKKNSNNKNNKRRKTKGLVAADSPLTPDKV